MRKEEVEGVAEVIEILSPEKLRSAHCRRDFGGDRAAVTATDCRGGQT